MKKNISILVVCLLPLFSYSQAINKTVENTDNKKGKDSTIIAIHGCSSNDTLVKANNLAQTIENETFSGNKNSIKQKDDENKK